MKMVNILGEEYKMMPNKEVAMQVMLAYVRDSGVPAKLVGE